MNFWVSIIGHEIEITHDSYRHLFVTGTSVTIQSSVFPSVLSEWLFPNAGKLISNKRCRLRPNYVEMIFK